jgi:hypothetical protein
MQVCTDIPKFWGHLKILGVGTATNEIHVESKQNSIFRIVSAFFLCFDKEGIGTRFVVSMPTQAGCYPRAGGLMGLF